MKRLSMRHLAGMKLYLLLALALVTILLVAGCCECC